MGVEFWLLVVAAWLAVVYLAGRRLKAVSDAMLRPANNQRRHSR